MRTKHYTTDQTVHYRPNSKLHTKQYTTDQTVHYRPNSTLLTKQYTTDQTIHYRPNSTLPTKHYSTDQTLHYRPNSTLQTNQYTTDQTVHYKPNSTYVLYLFMPFSWIHALLFHKSREREDGVGGWGLTGTRIDMSSFYLPNEFFFSSELRRHSEKTLHYRLSPLADANV